MKGLSPEEIEDLLKEPERKKKTTVHTPGTTKSHKVDVSVRTYETWFALYHRLYDATCNFCSSERMCAELDTEGQVLICRICFLDNVQ